MRPSFVRMGIAWGALLGFTAVVARAQDPDVSLTQVRADATIDSMSGDVANGAGEFLLLGRDVTGHERRALLYFAVDEIVPRGSVILDATLEFHLVSGAAPLEMRRVTESWREGRSNPIGDESASAPAGARDVTWDYRNYGTQAPWLRPGGSLVSQPSAEFSVSGGDLLYSVSLASPAIRSDIQGWIDAPDQNHGWCLSVGETTTQLVRIESKDGSGNYKPHLWVRYYLPDLAPSNYCESRVNSSGQAAHMGAAGSTSWSANSLHLTVRGAPHGTVGAFACGPLETQKPFGNGFLCIAASSNVSIRRFGPESVSAQGTVDHRIDLFTGAGSFIHPSSVWYFQFWFRDAGAPPFGFNLSDGLCVVVYP